MDEMTGNETSENETPDNETTVEDDGEDGTVELKEAEDLARLRVATADLRWNCDPESLGFETTAEVEPTRRIVAQDDALDALRFGLEVDAPGQNVYVRGLVGTGRLTMVRKLLEEIRPECPLPQDRMYVRNFEQPERPRLLTLPRGRGRVFCDRVDELREFLRTDLRPALESESLRSRRMALEEEFARETREVGKPFDEELKAAGLSLVQVQHGEEVQTAIVPLREGKPVPPDEYRRMVAEETIGEAEAEETRKRVADFSHRYRDVNLKLQKVQRRHRTELREVYQAEARTILESAVEEILAEHPEPEVQRWLEDLVDDIVDHRLRALEEGEDFTMLYRVNVIVSHTREDCPIVSETAPTLQNLLGTIDRELLPGGRTHTDHTMIRAGSILRADGGYLILEAREVLTEPGAWKVLLRTLRSGCLEIVPPEMMVFWSGTTLKPEPIPVNVKVVLIGDPGLYYALDAHDPDFPHLFKVLADFESTMPRDAEGVARYAGILARLAADEGLPPLHKTAVAALAEHGARIAQQAERLTTRFGRLADIAREAGFLARKARDGVVRADHVAEAVQRSKRRGDLPARNYRQYVAAGTIRIETAGKTIGQVNGLAMTQAGPLTYGHPARITASIGPGSRGTINIEREAQLSGAIHTKGFYILGGLLQHLLRTEHPLTFSASIAFEQSYGGIDGDSASGAEMCCLLSALTEIPLRQDLAMTGAIDQHGHIGPIGATNEKIEGFFDTCLDAGLTGTQGVIIPKANVGDLMLRPDVVAACAEDRFHLYAVETIQEALEVFTGVVVGERLGEDAYAPGTLLRVAVERAFVYWMMASKSPLSLAEEVAEAEEQEKEPAAAAEGESGRNDAAG